MHNAREMRRVGPAIVRLAVLAGVLAAGCGPTVATPSPAPTGGPALGVPELKLALVRQLGPLWFCDPDVFPIQRQDELAAALERWPEVIADAEALQAILGDLGIPADDPLDDDAKLAVYRSWKVLNAIALEPEGDAYRFDYLAQPAPGGIEGTRTTGTISASGDITVGARGPAPEPMCPICLGLGTPIETPGGAAAVERLRTGDTVWTLDDDGRRIPGIVLAIGSVPVPDGHRMMRLVLDDGRSITASAGHPLADGRPLGEIRPGDRVDGSTVVGADGVPYAGSATYDIVVSGPTGTYLVDGIPLGSTLDRPSATSR